MSVVKRAMLLLLLAAVGANAALSHEGCEDLNKTMLMKDLHKISGYWVLVWSVALEEQSLELLANLTSSHVEMQLLPDNITVMYNERNMFHDKSCTKYFLNMTIPSELSNLEHLRIGGGTLEKDGVAVLYNDTAEVNFYKTRCSDCMVMVYRGQSSHFLLFYNFCHKKSSPAVEPEQS